MFPLIETPTFSADVKTLWKEKEHGEFCAWLAANPEAGNVIPGTGGCRKIRWSRRGMGKRGGVRIIYYTKMINGKIWLLMIYAKNVRENIPSHLLKKIKEVIENES